MSKENHNHDNTFFPGACSCMTLTSKTGNHYWFRTCDIENDIWALGAHVVQKKAGQEITYFDGKTEEAQYSYAGMTYNHEDTWLLDGINEHGLTGGLLMLYEGTGVDKAGEGRLGYMGMEIVTKILSSCKQVEEVKDLAKNIRVLNIPYGKRRVPAVMHYFFVDPTGNEVILEATDIKNPGIFQIYPREEILGIMTNSPPYPLQLENLSWFLSQSPEMKQGINGQAITELKLDGRSIKAEEKAQHLSLNGTFPASYSSYDRFIRIAVLKALNHSGNEFGDEKMQALGSNLMNTVWEPCSQGVFHYTRIEEDGSIIGQKDSFTQYLIMYHLEKRSFDIKKYDEIIWQHNELKERH